MVLLTQGSGRCRHCHGPQKCPSRACHDFPSLRSNNPNADESKAQACSPAAHKTTRRPHASKLPRPRTASCRTLKCDVVTLTWILPNKAPGIHADVDLH